MLAQRSSVRIRQSSRMVVAVASKAGGLFHWAWLLSSLLFNPSSVQSRKIVSPVLDIETSQRTEVNVEVLYAEAPNITISEAVNDRHLGPLYRPIVSTVRAAKHALTVTVIFTHVYTSGFSSTFIEFWMRPCPVSYPRRGLPMTHWASLLPRSCYFARTA